MSKKSQNMPKLRFPEFKAEDEWEENNIGKISKNVTAGGTPSTLKKEYWGGNIRWMNSGELNNKKIFEVQGRITKEGLKNSSTKLIPENCILIGLAGQGKTRGTVAINRVELCMNQSIAAIYPNKKIFNSDFLYHNLDNRYKELRNLSAGSDGRGGLNLTLIKSINIYLPSIEEQKKIADCLTSIDNLILSSSKKVEVLKEHKKGLMQQLFPRNDEKVPNQRFSEFNKSGDWDENTLINVAKFRRGSFPQPYGLSKWYDDVNGMPFVQVYDVDDNLQLKATTKRKISQLATEQSIFIKKGTVIVTIQGSIGRVAITQYDAYIDRTLLLFEKFLKPMNKLFFAYVIENLFAIEKEKAPGGIIKTITKEVLSSFVIKFPSEKEQEKIATAISSIDALILKQTQKVEALKDYKKGLMQQLFPSNEVDK